MYDNSFWGSGTVGDWNISIGNSPYPSVATYPYPYPYGGAGGGVYGGVYGGTYSGSRIDGTLILVLIVLGVLLLVK